MTGLIEFQPSGSTRRFRSDTEDEMAKMTKPRKRYTPEQWSKILTAASKEGLTAAAVQKRFGVSEVTYYSWRKKVGKGKRRRTRERHDGRPPQREAPGCRAGPHARNPARARGRRGEPVPRCDVGPESAPPQTLIRVINGDFLAPSSYGYCPAGACGVPANIGVRFNPRGSGLRRGRS